MHACFQTLLEVGANPEGSKKNRCSPLLVAVRDGFVEGVRVRFCCPNAGTPPHYNLKRVLTLETMNTYT